MTLHFILISSIYILVCFRRENALLSTSHCSVALYLNKMGSNYETAGLMLGLHPFWGNTNRVIKSLVREPDPDRLERIPSLPPSFLEFQMVKRNSGSLPLLWQLTEKYFCLHLVTLWIRIFSTKSVYRVYPVTASSLEQFYSGFFRNFSGDSIQGKISTASLWDTALSEYLACFFKKKKKWKERQIAIKIPPQLTSENGNTTLM